MNHYKILFFPRYSNPFDAVPYSQEVDFEAASVGEAVRRLKREVPDFARSRHYMISDVKGYLLKRNAKYDAEVAAIEARGEYVAHYKGKLREWKWIKVAWADYGRSTTKVHSFAAHTEASDPTISHMNLGRRNFR